MIQAVEDMGQLDNTLIIYIAGDNGASQKACQRHVERVHHLQRHSVPVKDQILWYPFWGSERDLPALRGALGLGDGYAVQVGEAGRVALRRNGPGPAMSWPGHINDTGASADSSTI